MVDLVVRQNKNTKLHSIPTTQRAIFFDQRGSGQSTPAGSLDKNTTQDLVSDISKIADKLNIDTFNLHGSSWGSALALAYGIAHPERVANIIIGGVLRGLNPKITGLIKVTLNHSILTFGRRILIEHPNEFHEDPSAYHFDKVENGTLEEQKASGFAYECLEGGVIQLDDRFTPSDFTEYDQRYSY